MVVMRMVERFVDALPFLSVHVRPHACAKNPCQNGIPKTLAVMLDCGVR